MEFDSANFGNETKILNIFHDELSCIFRLMNRSFLALLGFQWAAAVAISAIIRPQVWLGGGFYSNESLYLSFFLGGILFLLPFYFVFKIPGTVGNRLLVTVCQVLFSMMFIILFGGRTEAHFHIFISLALIAFYKDWKLLLLAGGMAIAVTFFIDGFFPVFTYGVAAGNLASWKGYGFWFLVEVLVLCLGIFQSRRGMLSLARSRYALVEAKEEAIRLSKVKSDFLSYISHEFCTPLSSIIGFSDLLKETNLESDQKKYVEIVHRCSVSLSRLINEFLDLSKIENGLIVLDVEPFDLRSCLDEVLDMLAIQASDKKIKFELKFSDDIPKIVLGDAHRIQQVLVNLIGNAVKFTENGIIAISCDVENSELGIYKWSVKDSGVGIAAEDFPKLFNTFYQGKNFRKLGGNGLGLAVTKNLIHLMGGEISIESRLGEGSEVSFTMKLTALPLKA
jgi:hypothetical protein